jgi:hypothetical protein
MKRAVVRWCVKRNKCPCYDDATVYRYVMTMGRIMLLLLSCWEVLAQVLSLSCWEPLSPSEWSLFDSSGVCRCGVCC